MNKIYGTQIRQDGLYKIGKNKWELFYGFYKDEQNDDTGYNYRQKFGKEPTAEEVKSIIISQINANTNESIVSGFVWNGMPVWLSSENQFNYKSAYDMAIQTNGESLPVTFKLGTEGNPSYYTFEDLTSLTDFYQKQLAYIQELLSAGWKEKDAIDWSVFECAE